MRVLFDINNRDTETRHSPTVRFKCLETRDPAQLGGLVDCNS